MLPSNCDAVRVLQASGGQGEQVPNTICLLVLAMPQTLDFVPGSGHVLISTVKNSEEIEAVAQREGWRSQEVETGLFKIVKLWIDGTVLVELFAKGEAQRYIDAFGASGMATLEDRLRNLETTLGKALADKLPPQVLAEALGQPT